MAQLKSEGAEISFITRTVQRIWCALCFAMFLKSELCHILPRKVLDRVKEECKSQLVDRRVVNRCIGGISPLAILHQVADFLQISRRVPDHELEREIAAG